MSQIPLIGRFLTTLPAFPFPISLLGNSSAIFIGSSAELVGKDPFSGSVLGGSTAYKLVVQKKALWTCG